MPKSSSVRFNTKRKSDYTLSSNDDFEEMDKKRRRNECNDQRLQDPRLQMPDQIAMPVTKPYNWIPVMVLNKTREGRLC